jgi:CHRD domain/PEP-CTERM motif
MRRVPLLLAAAIALAPVPASAVSIFKADLSGANERPVPNASPAEGDATVLLSDDETMLTVHVRFGGLTAPAVAAHIHCCSDTETNSPVRVDFGGLGFPFGVTEGEYDSGDLLLADVVSGISVADFLAGLKGGFAYVNIHNANFPGGEIRGQLLVPEPAIGGLMLLGVGLLAATRRRR